MEELTERQRAILDYIRQHIDENGYPPTVREIGAAFSIRSTNGVADHLRTLQRKGYLERGGSLKSRALRLQQPDPAFNEPPEHHADAPHSKSAATVTSLTERRGPQVVVGSARLVSVPLLGRVAAGQPILAEEQAGDSVQVDSFLLGGHKRVFALRVTGDSMIGDGIFDGDYIFVKKQLTADPGEIVVALIENEATVKRYFPEGDRIRFQPSNPRLEPIYVRREDFRETMILGVVIGVYRKY